MICRGTTLFALTISTLLLAGCAKKKAALPVDTVVTVSVEAAKSGNGIATVAVVGSLIAVQDISLSPKQAGKLNQVLVREGDVVRKGQILARIDDTDLASQVREDEASLISDEAKVGQAKASFDQQLRDTVVSIKSAEFALDQQIATSESQITSAESALRASEQSLSTSLQGARPEERNETIASLASAQASYNKAESDLRRYTRLHDAGAISDADLDQYISSQRVALANLNSAAAALRLQQEGNRRQDVEKAKEAVRQSAESLRQAIAARDTDEIKRADLETAFAARRQDKVKFADVVSARAVVNEAQNTLAIAQKAVADTILIAPINGTISSRSAELGEVVTTATTLFHLVSNHDLYYEPSIAIEDLAGIHAGQTVLVTVEGYSSQVFVGHIVKVYPTSSATSRSTIVRINLPNSDGRLRANMFAQGNVVTTKHRQVVLIPDSSVISLNSDRTVFTVENGTLILKHVKLGLASFDGGWIEANGISAGQELVTSDKSGLKDKQEVKIISSSLAKASSGSTQEGS